MTLKNHGDLFDRNTLIGSQMQQPLLEFSGACEGCSETAYMKLATQMCGERMTLAQATGCSSIWGGTWGTIPYTTNEKGHGPAWGNSLFEDGADYGFGMAKANEAARNRLRDAAAALVAEGKASEELIALCRKFVAGFLDAKVCEEVYDAILPLLEKDQVKYCELYGVRNYCPKLSQWIQGGDGWAYDIGYGGLDHVIASGVDLNVVVVDTEMYSNTGGQKSKATPMGAVAKFAAAGNRRNKKDLGMMAMSYKNIYVASVSLQANPEQAIQAFKEAEAYPGCSLILCYAPCREQGFNISNAIEESRLAVASGYWNLYRYNPLLAKEGKNPFSLDSKEITADLKSFLARENRYALLMRTKKDLATGLQDALETNTKKRFANLQRLAAGLSTKKEAPKRTPGDVNKRVFATKLEAADRLKNFNEVVECFSKEDAVEESKRCLNCKKPFCKEACPAHLPIPQYIQAIKASDYDEGARLVLTVHPFLNVCGRACSHPCEAKCVRTKKGEALSIMYLKRTLATYGKSEVQCEPDCGKKVAVIGSGPAGLQASFMLAKKGIKVTLFEADSVAGGKMTSIPAYKLPKACLDEDIQRVVSLPNVELKLNSKVEDIVELKKSYDAVIIATGGKYVPSRIEKSEFVIDFMNGVKKGRTDVGKNVIINGSGLPAFDAARSCARLGAKVTMTYLETVYPEDAAEAVIEGVKIVKDEVDSYDGKTAVMKSGAKTEADTVVAACNCLNVADDAVKGDGIFSVGDSATGMSSIIQSVGQTITAVDEIMKTLGF
jgi:pyruvate/2-oxoacid:ferredoxin oxidoreductase beta subunit